MSEDGSFWVDEENKELVLVDEGEEERFYIEQELEVNNNQYLILVPSEEEDENQALVLKREQEDGEDVLRIIEDDQEFEDVKQAYLNQ